MIKNKFSMTFRANSENEAFSRNVIASFCIPLNPTLDQIGDIKTAVSEAVTNCIVHAYNENGGEIEMSAFITEDGLLDIVIKDYGVGIIDVSKAVEPFYTTKAETERSGMGFTVMQTFMDNFEVQSEFGKGTTVHMSKKIMCGGKDAWTQWNNALDWTF